MVDTAEASAAEHVYAPDDVRAKHDIRWLFAYTSLLIVFWTLIIAFSFWFGLTGAYKKPEMSAKKQVELILAKDYTSVGPSSEMRAMNFYGREQKPPAVHVATDHGRGVLARIVGREVPKALRPDAWESKALDVLEQGFVGEVVEVAEQGDAPHLRFLLPLPGGGSCASCHTNGDGSAITAVSFSVPMESLWREAGRQVQRLLLLHGGLWALGVCVFLLVDRILRRRIRERIKAESALRVLSEELEERVSGRTAEVLRRQRELRTFVDNTDAGVFLKNTNHEFVLYNRYLADLVHLPKDRGNGGTLGDYIPAKFAGYLEEQESEVVESRQSREIDFSGSLLGAPDRLFSLLLFPVIAQSGEVQGVGGILVDVSHHKKLERELLAAKESAETASRIKSDFLANISHEIRTPLNGVIGMADLLLRSNLTPDQASMAATIKTGGDGLLTVLNDVLDFSKIEAGKIALEERPFSLRDAFFDAVKGLAPVAYKKGIELLLRILPDVPDLLVGDMARIRQILLNLVSNAIKFTSEGEVIVRVECLERDEQTARLRISVTDTGIGIPEETRRVIFEAFEQADSSTTRKYGGTGLGLAISSRLATLMGSQLKVDSVYGQGSTFHLELALPVKSDFRPPKLHASVEALRDMKILVVDDNETNRVILSEQMQSWGMRPHATADVDSALSLLRTALQAEESFHIVLTDLQMPGKDGLTLIAEMTADESLRVVPVIMLSSGNLPEDEPRPEILKANLTKPARPGDLVRSMASALNVRESMELPFADAEPIVETDGRVGLRILLAEDMEINQLVASRLLKELGHSVRVVGDGRAAVQALEKESFDLVFMDIQMPVLDGVQAMRRIREREAAAFPPRYTPIVAMTAHALKGDREKYLEAGMDGYVAKPVVQESLARVMEDVLAACGQRRAAESTIVADTVVVPHVSEVDDERTGPNIAVTAEALEASFGGDREFAAQSVRLFMRDAPGLTWGILEAVRTDDNEALALNAHALKGMVGYFTQGDLYEAAFELEMLGRKQALPTLAVHVLACLVKLDGLLKRLLGGMKDFLG